MCKATKPLLIYIHMPIYMYMSCAYIQITPCKMFGIFYSQLLNVTTNRQTVLAFRCFYILPLHKCWLV